VPPCCILKAQKNTTENTEHTEKKTKNRGRVQHSPIYSPTKCYFIAFFRVFRVFRGDFISFAAVQAARDCRRAARSPERRQEAPRQARPRPEQAPPVQRWDRLSQALGRLRPPAFAPPWASP
jgi:hypothetical protein